MEGELYAIEIWRHDEFSFIVVYDNDHRSVDWHFDYDNTIDDGYEVYCQRKGLAPLYFKHQNRELCVWKLYAYLWGWSYFIFCKVTTYNPLNLDEDDWTKVWNPWNKYCQLNPDNDWLYLS